MIAIFALMATGAAGAAAGAVARAAGGSGLGDCAVPSVVKSPAARAETSPNLEFMCGVVLLQDPSGISSLIETGLLPAGLSCIHSTQGRAFSMADPYRFAQF